MGSLAIIGALTAFVLSFFVTTFTEMVAHVGFEPTHTGL